jgi:hypothetical protein
MTDIVDWLRQCATNEPNNSDAESLWAAGDLITFLRSSLKEIREENDRLKGERDEAVRREMEAVTKMMHADARAALSSRECEAMAKALEQCVNALSRCYDVSDWPADGRTVQDEAIRTGKAVIAEYRKETGA